MHLFSGVVSLLIWNCLHITQASVLRPREINSAISQTSGSSPASSQSIVTSNVRSTADIRSSPSSSLETPNTITISSRHDASFTSASNATRLSTRIASSTSSHAALQTSNSSPLGASTATQQDELPLQPQITPVLSIAGVILITTGIIYSLIGIKNRYTQVFLSSAYLTSLSITVLIVYVMSPPVSNGLQGAYLVAVVMTGLLFGAGSLMFQEIAEGFGCLLGGFCLSMWLLVLKPGGTITTLAGKVILIVVLVVSAWALSFHRVTRTYALIGSTSFSGATAVVLGVDCFTRVGLKEFWLYIWNLNANLFPINTSNYPITKGLKAETAMIVLLCLIGVISQLKFWNRVKDRREETERDGRDEERRRNVMEEALGRYLEARNDREKAQWESMYGEPDTNRRSRANGPESAFRVDRRKSWVSVREIDMENSPAASRESVQANVPRPNRRSASRSKRQSTLTVHTILEDDEMQRESINPAPELSDAQEGEQSASRSEEALVVSEEYVSRDSSIEARLNNESGIHQNNGHDPDTQAEARVQDLTALRAAGEGMGHFLDPIASPPALSMEPGSEKPEPSSVQSSKPIQPATVASTKNSSTRRSSGEPDRHEIACSDSSESNERFKKARVTAGEDTASVRLLDQGAFASVDWQRHTPELRGSFAQQVVPTAPTIVVSRPTSSGLPRASLPPKMVRHSSVPLTRRTVLSTPIEEDSETKFAPAFVHVTRPPLVAQRESFGSQSLTRSTCDLRSSHGRVSKAASQMYQQALANVSDTRLSSYSSHQPEQRASSFVPQKRESMLADWRGSMQQQARSSVMPDVNLEQRRAEMLLNRRQSLLSKQQQQTNRQHKDRAFEQAMRTTDMQALHRDAMRKMQAKADKQI